MHIFKSQKVTFLYELLLVIISFIIAESCSSGYHRIRNVHFYNTRERTPQKYLDVMLQKVIFCFNYQSNITCRKNLGFISYFCKYLYIREGNVIIHLGSLYATCYVLYWTANFPSKYSIIKNIKQDCPQSQIIENIYVCERASFQNLRIFFSLLHISLCTMIFKRYNQNLWGPLGSCPLCPLLNPALPAPPPRSANGVSCKSIKMHYLAVFVDYAHAQLKRHGTRRPSVNALPMDYEQAFMSTYYMYLYSKHSLTIEDVEVV